MEINQTEKEGATENAQSANSQSDQYNWIEETMIIIQRLSGKESISKAANEQINVQHTHTTQNDNFRYVHDMQIHKTYKIMLIALNSSNTSIKAHTNPFILFICVYLFVLKLPKDAQTTHTHGDRERENEKITDSVCFSILSLVELESRTYPNRSYSIKIFVLRE